MGASVSETPLSNQLHEIAAPAHGAIAPANWPDAWRGFYVTAGACFIAWRVPEKADWALIVLATIASPALVRAALDRFRK